MHRSQHQMPCLRCAQRQADGFQIAQFADHDHIRVLTQGAAQPLSEITTVPADLALVDQAALAAVDNLDRVFKSDDVQRPLTIKAVDQCRQRTRLATTGRAAHQHQAIRMLRNGLKHFFKFEFIDTGDTFRNQTKRGSQAVHLSKQTETKTPQRGQFQGQIQFIALHPLPALALVEQR